MEPSHRKQIIACGVFVAVLVVIIAFVIVAGQPPRDFPSGTVIVIAPGSSVRQVGELLEQNHIVRSGRYFDLLVKLSGGRSIVAGQFGFTHPESVYKIENAVTRGVFGSAQARITIPEGSSVADIADIVQKQIPTFDTATFIKDAKSSEGSLFPETYFVFKTITPDDLITRLQNEFQSKLAPLQDQIKSTGRSQTQIIIMASLLEKEAKNANDAAIISGILWKRMKAGIALDVDAPFYYALNLSPDSMITAKELATDGPYNTYTRKGLPAGAIGNPGLVMINAAIHPINSQYWYYLYDKNGTVHYAVTYAEHQANIKKYLR